MSDQSMDCSPFCTCGIDQWCPGWDKRKEMEKEMEKGNVFEDKVTLPETGIGVAGVKHDNNKIRWDLFPADSLEEIGKVLTYGARKYAPDNWKYVQGWKPRYFSALMRHMWTYWKGEDRDPETGLSHLAHAGCCILFLLGMELQYEKLTWSSPATEEDK